MFNNDSMEIHGRWINKRTGEAINVRSSVIDGDNMIIISDKGDIPMSVFSNEYIQMSEEEYDPKKYNVMEETDIRTSINNRNNNPYLAEEIKAAPKKPQKSEIIPETSVKETAFKEPTVKETKTQKNEQKVEQKSQKSLSSNLLETLFSKKQLNIKLKLDIECSEFPAMELKMLQEIYDIDIKDMTDYIINNVFNKNDIPNAVSLFILSKMNEC